MRSAVEAAVALARVQADDDSAAPPPRGLRPFLRFTRLPDRAVTAARKVLDEDEGFRDQVRRSTSEDLVGRASWLFLERAQGWEDELDALIAAASHEASAASQRQAESATSRRLAAADAARRRAEEAAARLGAELAETKELVASERRARRRIETDAGRSRRRSSDLEAEVAELRSLVARLQQTLEDRAAHVELRGGDGAELGPPQAEAGSAAGAGLAFDPRTLAASYGAVLQATDGITGALADLGRELAPLLHVEEPSAPAPPAPRSPPVERPPERTRQPAALPPAILEESVEAAEHLLRTEGVVVLVDGYNLTKLARPEMTLPEQRRWLVDAAVETATRTGARFEVVFDGAEDQGSAPADLARRSGVQVRFSPAGVDADDVVLERARAPGQGVVVVASDDRRVRDGARRLGANVVGAAQLLAAMKRPLKR